MPDEKTQIGNIHVSPRAIATIAYQAVLQSYGVVGMASKNIVNGLAQMLVKDPTKGVEVIFEGDLIRIDLYIIVEYGTRVKSVAMSVANTVRYHVERSIGTPVTQINVHVQGLRISNID